MSQEDDADLQEAIRRSLLEVRDYGAGGSQHSASHEQPPRDLPSGTAKQPPPFYIELPSDDEDNYDYEEEGIADVSMNSNPPDYLLSTPSTLAQRGDEWPDPYGQFTQDDAIDRNEDEDEDLKRAIALSLQESGPSRPVERPEPLVHEPYEQPELAPMRTTESKDSPMNGGQGDAPPSLTSLLGQSRAEMERQRQERLRKRLISESQGLLSTVRAEKKARLQSFSSTSPPQADNHGALSRLASPPRAHVAATANTRPVVKPEPERKGKQRSEPTSSAANVSSSSSSTASVSASSSEPRLMSTRGTDSTLNTSPFDYPIKYTKATFLNTHIFGTVKEKTHVSLEDLLDKTHLQKAVLTTYISDPMWLINYLPTDKKVVLAVHWYRDRGEQPGYYQRDGYPNGLLEYHPPLPSMGSFHPKLMVLYYPTFCRIVISSANLVPDDWLKIVNTFYVQDFPYRESLAQTPEQLGDFGATLHNFLHLLELPQQVLMAILAVDFSLAKVHLIPSVQGSYLRDGKYRYGTTRLSQVMRNNTVRRPWDMEYQTGSLGKLNVKFLIEFYNACQGKPVIPRSRYNPEQRIPPIKVIYPTEETVQNGTYGEEAGRTIAFQLNYWNELTFPRKVMHDYVCRGSLKNFMMHSKLILARASENDGHEFEAILPKPKTTSKLHQAQPTEAAVPEEPIPENLPSWEGWFLVGSHNFTESAWGSVQKKPDGLYSSMRNWELSVLCPVESADDFVNAEGLFGAMPVPFERPVRQYTSRDRPWTGDRY